MRWSLLLFVSALTTSCGGDGPRVTNPPVVATVDITPATANLEFGKSTRLVATPRTAGGAEVSGAVVTWTSSNVAVATVAADGTVDAVAIGSATMTATAGGKSNTATILVVAPTAPAARWLAGMVYDDVQGRVLLFGGFATSGSALHPLNDLWSWNGQRWTFLGAGGPSGRGDLLTAWDGVRQRLIIYGGANDAGSLGDTWEWDGTAWTQKATAGPPIRRHFGSGFDRQRGRVVLFGGLIGNNAVTDTWEWDGELWTQRATVVPSGFTAPAGAMAYSETRHALLMLVGSFTSASSALWQWDGSAWNTVDTGPTAAMPIPLAATGDDEITALLSNGTTLRWQGTGFTTAATSGPTVDGASMAFDRARNRLVLFGGLTAQATSSDTWLWNGSTWSKATP